MKKRFLALLLIPMLLGGCGKQPVEPEPQEEFNTASVDHPRKSGDIGAFNLLTPANGYSSNSNFHFTWEEASNSDYYQIELSSTLNFITDDSEEVYVKESNLSNPVFDLNYSLPKKDILYYWRVTAVNKDHTKKCNEIGNFFYESTKLNEIKIEIEDEQDWQLHKEGSYADIKIDRSDFFGTGENSLAIIFDKEHTSQGDETHSYTSDGWIVITKSEDRELYGTDSFYFNFYYSGHDANVLVRVLDYDGEYWHKQVQISNNAKQTILMRYEDFELRTAGTNIFNKRFDWQHIRYFEIVFERTFGDGVCLFSNIKCVNYADYSDMFINKVNFKMTDMADWTYENYNFPKTISESGDEITLSYTPYNAETNPTGMSGYGFQNVNVYKYLAQGDAVRMKVKYTGSSKSAMFYFRILEEDNDRWQFKISFSYFVQDDYKELVIPLKAFQRTDYMSGDGAKQFYFIQKFNFGLADCWSSGTLSVKDLEVIKIDNIVDNRKRLIASDGCIENFNNYNIYTEMYYYWDQSSANKDEAMKLDNVHKTGGTSNKYCAEFDYKADMEMAVYQLYFDEEHPFVSDKNAFSIWIKDASVKYGDSAIDYLKDEDIAAEMTIQLTMDTGEWYRYVIPKLKKEWNKYTILFSDFHVNNEDDLIDDPKPLDTEHIIHMAFGFKYLYYDQQGRHHPTYAIANPVYLDEIYFVNATATTIEELPGTMVPDTDDPSRITVETMEEYTTTEEIFGNWSYGNSRSYNSLELSNVVSSEGGAKSIKMHYKGADSVSYGRITQFARTITAKGVTLDIKGDGKATVYVNLNWRNGTTLYKMRYALSSVSDGWYRYQLGFDLFKDINGSSQTISSSTAKSIESISFGIVNSDGTESDIYLDNLRLLVSCSYTVNTKTTISQRGGRQYEA